VDQRAGLKAVEKRKICFPSRESNPGRPAYRTSLYWLIYPFTPEGKNKEAKKENA
jgi:hypothetical protein